MVCDNYPFKVKLFIGRAENAQIIEIYSDGESVSMVVKESTEINKSMDIMVDLLPDEIDVLISALQLFKKRIERGELTCKES